MAEELFNPNAESYVSKCVTAAGVNFDMITVSDWIRYRYRDREKPIYVVENGIDDDFKFHFKKDKTKTIVVEGWECNNAAKDTEGITRKAIAELKEKHNLKVIAYGQKPLKEDIHLIDEYYQNASTKKLSEIYNRAHFFIKASKYETRSLAPLEAMACGCIPIVAIVHGHPDLQHKYNSIRVKYNEGLFTKAIDSTLNSANFRAYRRNGLKTTKALRWPNIINNKIIPLLYGEI
jgi:hypothetical protein